MNIVAIIQARLGSTRFPGKVFAPLADYPLIWHVINRLKYSNKISKIVLATTINPLDDDLETWALKENITIFRGSENNVLERFYFSAKENNANIIVRITADDPFKDPTIIDGVIENLIIENLDFACNNNPPSYPEGLDTEVFTFEALEKAYLESTIDFEKEHVTQYFYRHPELFKQKNFPFHKNLSYLRWTIDTKSDFDMAHIIYENLYRKNEIFLMPEILEYLKKYPDIEKMNIDVERSAMYKKL
jgi:spore coat polysaccharide biosynthesis protein SpsF